MGTFAWTPRIIVLWLVGGQSNAGGRGVAAQAPLVKAGHGLEFIYHNTASLRRHQHIREPVGTTVNPESTGSAWSAFCNAFAGLTDFEPLIVSTAVGGTAQTIEAGQAAGRAWWEPGGARYSASVTTVNNVIAWLDASGDPWRFGGVLWDQGGQDAIQMDEGTPNLDKARYKDAFELMVDGWRTEFDVVGSWPFLISRLGRPASADTANWANVRDAQDELAAADADVHIGFDRAVEFPTDIPSKMADDFHYTQPGYDEMGTELGTYAAGVI